MDRLLLLRKTNFFFTIVLLSAPLVCMGVMMYLPSYAVKKTRLSSSGHTTYGKVYVLRCFPSGQVCLLRIHNSGNSILLNEMCMLFSSDHLLPRSKCLKQINIISWSQMSTEETRWCTTDTAFECNSKVQRLWKKIRSFSRELHTIEFRLGHWQQTRLKIFETE